MKQGRHHLVRWRRADGTRAIAPPLALSFSGSAPSALSQHGDDAKCIIDFEQIDWSSVSGAHQRLAGPCDRLFQHDHRIAGIHGQIDDPGEGGEVEALETSALTTSAPMRVGDWLALVCGDAAPS